MKYNQTGCVEPQPRLRSVQEAERFWQKCFGKNKANRLTIRQQDKA